MRVQRVVHRAHSSVDFVLVDKRRQLGQSLLNPLPPEPQPLTRLVKEALVSLMLIPKRLALPVPPAPSKLPRLVWKDG